MKNNIQKGLNVSLCIAIIMILAGSTVSYGMDEKLWSERDKKIALSRVIDCDAFMQWANLPHLYAGTSENNPLLWIVQKASDKQLDLFVRMHNEGSSFTAGNDREVFSKIPLWVIRYLQRVFRFKLQ